MSTPALLVAAFSGVLPGVVGVVLALTGAAVAVMGLIAMIERFVRRGACGVGAGLALLAAGLWLLGFLG